MCRELQRRVPKRAFKDVDVTYVPGAVVGREKRRSLVHRLQVQHAVCMLMNLTSRGSLMSVEEAFKLLGSQKGQSVWDWAKERALEQEKTIFGNGKGPTLPMYASLASRASALDWWEGRFKEKDGGDDVEDDQHGDDIGYERKGGPDTSKRKADLEERGLDFDQILQKRKKHGWLRMKRIVMELIDEQMVGSLVPELKLDLLKTVQAMCERGQEDMTVQTTRTRCSEEQLRAMLAPIVLRVTEPVRHMQKLQFTKM